MPAGTYETFERDPVKYTMYQQALERALTDMVNESDILTQTVRKMLLIKYLDHNEQLRMYDKDFVHQTNKQKLCNYWKKALKIVAEQKYKSRNL